MIYVIVMVLIGLALIGLASQQMAARNERRHTLTKVDRAELVSLRGLRDRLTTLAMQNGNTGEAFPTIVLDEIHTTTRAIEANRERDRP